jgi:hypothetical protein
MISFAVGWALQISEKLEMMVLVRKNKVHTAVGRLFPVEKQA